MTEQYVLDVIRREFQAMLLPPPDGLSSIGRSPSGKAWQRAARRIVSECEAENRQAARAASMAGALVTRGRTRL